MSGDHNQNQTDSGWRKRQIALNKKADNAREMGLDYEPNKTVIEMAEEAGVAFFSDEEIEAFAELVRADERNSWPLEMEAMERQVNILTDELAKAKAKEREACAKLAEKLTWADNMGVANAIRARGQA